MNLLQKQCYYCGAPATSREHVPAKIFFPSDRRQNVITVPACSLHNEDTSKDDTYIFTFIASYIYNNEVGQEHSVEKIKKILDRSPALKTALIEASSPICAQLQNGDIIETKKIELDRSRFDNEVTKIAKALYFHKYGEIWSEAFIIATPNLICSDGEIDEISFTILNMIKELSNNCFDYEGENPEVFKYVFLYTDAIDKPLLRMFFYEKFEIWVIPKIY